MTAPDRAALGERAARALSAWGLGDGFDKLHALIVDYRHEIRDAIRARGTESKTGGK